LRNKLSMSIKNNRGAVDIIVIVIAWLIAFVLVYFAYIKLRLFFEH
jgi:hypothetical protein